MVNASFHVTHWSVQPYGTGISRMKYVGFVFGGDVLRFFHGGDECLTIPGTWSRDPAQKYSFYLTRIANIFYLMIFVSVLLYMKEDQ